MSWSCDDSLLCSCSQGRRATRTLTPALFVFSLASFLGVFSLATRPSSPTLPVLRHSLLPPLALTMEQGRPHAILSTFITLVILRGRPRSFRHRRGTSLRRCSPCRAGRTSLPGRGHRLRYFGPLGLYTGH